MDLSKKHLTWPRLLSKKLKKPIVDDSMSGASNGRIFRRTSNNIILKNVNVAIVFLTKWSRMETGNPEWKTTIGHNIEFTETQQILVNSHNHDYYFETYFEPIFQYEIFLHGIINLQCLANQYNTKLYLLDNFAENLYQNLDFDIFCKKINFEHYMTRKHHKDHFFKKYKLMKELISHINFDNFISDKSYQELIGDAPLEEDHPLEEGHSIISDIVYNFIAKKI